MASPVHRAKHWEQGETGHMGISNLSGMGSGKPPPPPAGAQGQLIPPDADWEPGCIGILQPC